MKGYTDTVHSSLLTVHRENGFTIIELLIAITIGLIIIGATYATYISQQRSFTAQDQVAEMNATSKIALDMIANDIREAGFGVPDDLSDVQRSGGCPGINGYTERITFEDGNVSDPDSITIVGGFRLVGYINANYSAGSTTLVLTDTRIVNGTNSPPGDRSYISIGGMSFAIVSSVDNTTRSLTLRSGLNRSYPVGVPVYLIENRTYEVVFNAGDRKWELRRTVRDSGNAGCVTAPDGPEVIAENIGDFQIAYGYDTNKNGVIEPVSEWYNTIPAIDDGLLRIRVNILARTARPDPNFERQGNPPVRIENRNHAPTNDNFRRRWWQMEVDLRNQL